MGKIRRYGRFVFFLQIPHKVQFALNPFCSAHIHTTRTHVCHHHATVPRPCRPRSGERRRHAQNAVRDPPRATKSGPCSQVGVSGRATLPLPNFPAASIFTSFGSPLLRRGKTTLCPGMAQFLLPPLISLVAKSAPFSPPPLPPLPTPRRRSTTRNRRRPSGT